MKTSEIKNLIQKHYRRIKQFNRQEWNKMLKSICLLTKEQNKADFNETIPNEPKSKKQWAVGYDIQGKKVESDPPTKCPHCQTSINKTEMDIVKEKSNARETTWECLNCGQETTIRN